MRVLNGLAFLCLPLAGSVPRDSASPTAQQGTTRKADAPQQSDAPWTMEQDYILVKGMDALVASVANGLNVMPPRGGSALTDEEIPIAIQYMLSK